MSWRTTHELRHAAKALEAAATHLSRAGHQAVTPDLLWTLLASVRRLKVEVLSRCRSEDAALDSPHPYRPGLRGTCAWCRGAEDRHISGTGADAPEASK